MKDMSPDSKQGRVRLALTNTPMCARDIAEKTGLPALDCGKALARLEQQGHAARVGDCQRGQHAYFVRVYKIAREILTPTLSAQLEVQRVWPAMP